MKFGLVCGSRFVLAVFLSFTFLPEKAKTENAQHMYEHKLREHCGLIWVDYESYRQIHPRLVPEYSVKAGMLSGVRSKWEVFIARAMIEGYLKTGSVNSGGENMSLSHNGREVNESHFQVLTNPHGVALQWLSADWTSLPKTAIVGGMWEGKAVYIGRKKHSLHGDTVVGHVVAGDGALWYSWKGKEYVTTEFEILTSPSCPIAEKVGRSTEEKPSRTAWDAAAFMYNYQLQDQCGLVWSLMWNWGSDAPLPSKSVVAGKLYPKVFTNETVNMYVARALIDGQLKVGPFVEDGAMTVAHGGQEAKQTRYQVLTNPGGIDLKWISGPGVPPNAIVAGTLYGARVYIGRAGDVGNTRLGYLSPDRNGKLWFGVFGEEFTTEKWEILTATRCQTENVDLVIGFREPKQSAKARQLAQSMYDKKLQCGLVWAPNNGNSSEANAVFAGRENSTVQLYIARSIFAGQLKPGKFIVNTGMFVAFGEQEITQNSYQVLTNPDAISLNWVSGPLLPSNAIVAGSIDGKPVYIGRFGGENTTRLGYLFPARESKLRFSVYGHVYTTTDFQILVAPKCGRTV